jgi:MFS family permease
MGSQPHPHRWRSVYTLAFGNAIDNADGKLLNFIFPEIRKALQLNLESLGLMTAIGLMARMIFGPLWALAGDRWNRKWLMFLVTGAWGVWTVFAGLAQTEFQFLLLYTIATLGTVATEPLTSSLTADLFTEAERGRAFGVLRGLGGLLLFVFVPLGMFYTHFYSGWRWALYTVGGLSILSGIFVLIFVKEPGRGSTEEETLPDERLQKGDLAFLWRTPSLWLMAGSVCLMTSLIVVSFGLTFLTDVRALPLSQAQGVMFAFGLTFALSSLIGGRLGDWAHVRRAFEGRIALMQIFLLVYAVLTFLCFQIAWPIWAYYPFFFVFGLIAGIGVPGAVMPIISSVSLPETRSTAFGLLFSLVQGGTLALLSWIFPMLAQNYGVSNLYQTWCPTWVIPLVAQSSGQIKMMFWMVSVPYLLNAILWFAFYKTVRCDHDRVQAEIKRREALLEAATERANLA